MGDETGADDIVASGSGRRLRLPDWRPSRGAEILAVAALVVGLAAGYAAGSRPADGGPARPGPTAAATASPSASAPASPVAFDSLALAQDTGACSVQEGTDLELGVQFSNRSTQPLTLTAARAVLPIAGGLKQLTWQWGTCGALPGRPGQGVNIVVPGQRALVPGQGAAILMPGQADWLTVTFKVVLGCPAVYPVQFSVGYLAHGRSFTASLPGFPDLGRVPYSGCPPD